MIAGQSPRFEWKPNPPGQTRTLEQAITIARQHGVEIPEFVEFYLDELDELHANYAARGPSVRKPDGSIVFWSDLVHEWTRKVPFRIWPGILNSDEAIVAVL